jgi:hypothetical protein
MKHKKTDFDYRKVVDDLKTRPAKLRRTLGTISVEPIAVAVTPADLAHAELQVSNSQRWLRDVEFHKNVQSDLEEELKAARSAGNGSEAAAGGRRSQPMESRPSDRTRAERALSDPAKYPIMTPKEVMAALHLKKSVVYEHPKLVRASTGTRNVRFTTASVKAIRESSPE